MDFLQSETLLNLARAFAGESQARSRYSIYAAAARKEGHELLARLFEDTAHNELEHAEQFFALISTSAPICLSFLRRKPMYVQTTSISASLSRPHTFSIRCSEENT